MDFLRQRIIDSSLLQMVSRFLKSGIIEEGNYFETEQGTPQGGILSPVLANVYLHYVLDSWFENEVILASKYLKKKVRSLSSDDAHARGQRNTASSVKPLTFWVLLTSVIKPEEANSSSDERLHARSTRKS